MYRKRPAIIALFTVLIVLSWTVGVMAVPPLPSSFYGTVKVNGENVAFGTVVSAWIGGVKYAEDGTSFYAGDSNYGLQVPGDDPGTLGKDGGVEGETIVFRIGNLTADQTAIWHSGPNVHRDLTYTSSVQPGSITIRKETNPDGWGGFVFGGDLGWFGLDDGDSKTFDCLNPDNYDVTESVPRGWNLDQVECTGGDYNSITDGVQVQLGVGQDVVCTFTNEVQPGSITVVKETDPDGGTGFSFSGDLGGFSLDDDGSQAFGSLTPGDYDITEAVPAGWGLGSVVCTGGDSGRITNGVTVHLGPDEDVTCTFTNVEPPGSIMVWKETDPDGWGPFDFGGDLGLFSLSDNSGRLFSTLASGQYDVTEVVPGGWNLVDVTCTGGSNTGIANGVRVQLGAGEDVICTFTNEAQPGSITVVKDTDPAGGMGFGFSGDLGGFSLDDDGSRAFGSLTPGDYDITEVVPGGWGLGSVVCTGGDSSQITNGVTVHLGPDEDVTCTFTNVEEPPEPGSVTIWKQTDPAGGTGFGFSGDLGSFGLSDDGSRQFSNLSPGNYDIRENVPSGWDLDRVVCTGDSSTSISGGVQVQLGEGDDVTCTFYNVEEPPEPGSIRIRKQTDPAGGMGFGFSGGLGSFGLSDDGSRQFSNLSPGNYDIRENVPSGWDLDRVVCTDGSSTSISGGVQVQLGEGDDVICTFYNIEEPPEPGSITVRKQTDPAGGTGFGFSGSLGGFTLDDGQGETTSSLLPGDYDITEDVPAGWDLTGVVCTGGDYESIADGVWVHLGSGEDIVCTFENTEFCSVTVAKVSDPSGGTGYSFAGDLGSFSLDDGESKSFEQVPAGDWSITEVLPSGWKMDSVVCTGADSESVADGVMVHMDPGDDVTCTFTNVTQPGSITIAKATDPAGGVGFEFAGDLGGFRLDDGESETFTDVSMGTYDVTEVVPAGWVLQDVVCTGGATEPIPDGVRVHLDEGEAILCTFTNVQHRFYFPWVAVGPKSGSFIDARRRTRLRASLHLWRGGRPGARRCHSLGQDLGELSRNPWLRRGLGPVGTWASCHGPPPATQGA